MTSDIAGDGTAASTISAMVKAGVSFLADLIDRIVNGIKGLAPFVLGFGCQSGEASAPEIGSSPAPAVVTAPAEPTEQADGPKAIGKFNITFYYVIGEEEIVPKPAVANDTSRGGGS